MTIRTSPIHHPALSGSSAALVSVLVLTTSSGFLKQEHTFRVFDEDGVTVAETSGGPKYDTELFSFERLARIHEDENRPESLMGNPSSDKSRMGEDGSVFVTDVKYNRILRFDAAGEYLNGIGGQGQGPGEYLGPRLLSTDDGTVTIWDPMLNRTSFYRYDGTFLESEQHFGRRSLAIYGLYRGTGGELVHLEYRTEFEGRRAYVYHSYFATIYSTEHDTIATLVAGPVKGHYQIGGWICWRLFTGFPSATYHPDRGIIMTTGNEPVFKYYRLDGTLSRIVRLNIPAEPVTRRERRAWAVAERHMLEQTPPEGLSMEQERLRHVEFNDPKGFWTDVTVDHNGFIWAAQPGDTFRGMTGTGMTYEHLVFSPEGEYLGITNLPGASAISRGHLITRQDNEAGTGIELVVYRIVPAVPGLEFP